MRLGKERVTFSRPHCGLYARFDIRCSGGSGCAARSLFEKLAMHRLFEQVGQQKSLLEALADRHRAMTLDDDDRMILELVNNLFGLGHRRRVLRYDRHFADRVLLFKAQGHEAFVGQGERQNHRRVNVNDRLGIRAAVNRHVHRCFARSPLVFSCRLAGCIDPHQILSREKSQRRMLSGDQKMVAADAATEIAAPAADQPPLEQQLAPMNDFSIELGHAIFNF